MDIYEHFSRIVAESKISVCVIELGACDGADTVKMNQILKNSGLPYEQMVIEPCADNFKILKSKTRGLDVETLFGAVGSENAIVDFWYSNNKKYYGSSSIRAPKESLALWPDMTFEKTKIHCTTLDFLSEERNVDFIWVDVQGAEVDVIKGGRKTLERTRYLYTEYSDKELYEGEIKIDEILNLLPEWEVVEQYDHDVLLRNSKR